MTQRKDAIDNLLSLRKACPEAVVWSRQFATLEEAWLGLEAPDWALWALQTFGFKGERKLRLFATICAQRVRSLWNDPQQARAIELAGKVSSGAASPAELPAAYLATKSAAAAIVQRRDYCEAMAAAAAATVAALHSSAHEAAMGASRESARAAAWDPSRPGTLESEGIWQCDELRRIVGDDIHAVIAEARRSTRGTLAVL